MMEHSFSRLGRTVDAKSVSTSMSRTFPARLRRRARRFNKRRLLGSESSEKAFRVASTRREFVRKSWTSSGVGGLDIFLRSFRSLRTGFSARLRASAMEVLGYLDWMTGWGISFARKFKNSGRGWGFV